MGRFLIGKMSERKIHLADIAVEQNDQFILNKGVGVKVGRINHVTARLESGGRTLTLTMMDLPSGQAVPISEEHRVSFIGKDELGHGLFNIQGATEYPSVIYFVREPKESPKRTKSNNR